MTDADLRAKLLDLACHITDDIRAHGPSTYLTQNLHDIVSSYFILRPYDAGTLVGSSEAGFSNRPVDVSEPGLLTKRDPLA